LKVALAQTDIHWEDKESNKIKASELLIKAEQNNVDLILFPEMSLTGFSMNTDKIGEDHYKSSSTVEWFRKEAAVNNINIGFGYVEKPLSASKGKNNYCVVSAEGAILSNYSKIHPFSYGLESKYYAGGDKLSFFQINDFIISTFICYDLRFPEVFQLASKQAALITVAANWPKARREHWIALLRARAIENQCFIAGVNRVGSDGNIEYSGDSLLINPLGNILLSGSNTEELLIQDINIEDVHNLRSSFNLKADRREALYYSLYSNT
jgi:omega-amidase